MGAVVTEQHQKPDPSSPDVFRHILRVVTKGGMKPLAKAVDKWQLRDFRRMDAGWGRAAGYDVPESAPNRAWLERPRGHSKTQDVAAMVLWAMRFARRPLVGVSAAGDEDQASFLKDAIERHVQTNRNLFRDDITIRRDRVLCKQTGSRLEIVTSDALTAFGELPDLIILDEVSHWKSRELWDAMLSAAAKKPNCFLVAMTNAGRRESWQWRLRQAVKGRKNWHFSALPGPVASWISKDDLAEQEALLLPHVFERLWLNRWTSGAGDAISDDDLQAAIALDGPPVDRRGYVFIGGLDLGLTRDAAAFVVAGRHVGHSELIEPDRPALPRHMALLADAGLADAQEAEADTVFHAGSGKFSLFGVRVWEPPRGGKVDIGAIEAEILSMHQEFGLAVVGYDPWQSEYLAQRLRGTGLRMEQLPFTPGNLQRMATAVIQGFRDRNVELFDDSRLVSDLRNLRAVEKSYGTRLEPGKSQAGEGTRHGDAAMAFAISLTIGQDISHGPARINRPLVCYPA